MTEEEQIYKKELLEDLDLVKEKTTFNLQRKTIKILEDIWYSLRNERKGNTKITKTLIVELAIEIAAEDFKYRKNLGSLALKLNEIENKPWIKR